MCVLCSDVKTLSISSHQLNVFFCIVLYSVFCLALQLELGICVRCVFSMRHTQTGHILVIRLAFLKDCLQNKDLKNKNDQMSGFILYIFEYA